MFAKILKVDGYQMVEFDWRAACMDAERRYMEMKRERDFYTELAKAWEDVFYCDECTESVHACQLHSSQIMNLDQKKKDL